MVIKCTHNNCSGAPCFCCGLLNFPQRSAPYQKKIVVPIQECSLRPANIWKLNQDFICKPEEICEQKIISGKSWGHFSHFKVSFQRHIMHGDEYNMSYLSLFLHFHPVVCNAIYLCACFSLKNKIIFREVQWLLPFPHRELWFWGDIFECLVHSW